PALRVALVSAGLVFGLVVGQLVATGQPESVVGLALVVVPVVLWKRPHLAPVVILLAALSIEQFGQAVALATGDAAAPGTARLTAQIPVTAQIPLFHGLGSLHLAPADLLLLAVLGLCLAKTQPRSRRWPRSAVTAAVLGAVGAVALGIVVGIAHHGSVRVALMEARPFVYLATTYLLASMLITSRTAIRAALWGVVLASGLKAAQGLVVFFSVRNMHPRPEAILGHEEALFFGLFVFLAASLWLFDVPGRLRTTATWLLPLVIAADLANNRRSAWILLAGGLLVLAAIGLRCLPARRRFLWRTLAAVLTVSAVYFPAYWNQTGGLAQPARALHSLVAPDPRDASSNLYRSQEDANLRLNIREGGLLGRGFGVPIDYALPIADIKSIDPLISYVPHNGVLYVLMRLGLLGGIALWALLAAGIISGCRLARSADRELALVGALLVCALFGYALEGAIDQGFFFYRIAFVVGSLLGLAEAARRLERTAAARRFDRLTIPRPET
ncbi:MAG: hypothetical protein M3067_09390, partial [Chloroflexota bacterium]|nr:hypothetical protein [Chloroflexota bacterium]